MHWCHMSAKLGEFVGEIREKLPMYIDFLNFIKDHKINFIASSVLLLSCLLPPLDLNVIK